MELVLIWLGTIVASFGMEVALELKMRKENNGLKINIKRITEFSKHVNPNVVKVYLGLFFIPVINIISVMQRIIKYNKTGSKVAHDLIIIGVLKYIGNNKKKLSGMLADQLSKSEYDTIDCNKSQINSRTDIEEISATKEKQRLEKLKEQLIKSYQGTNEEIGNSKHLK